MKLLIKNKGNKTSEYFFNKDFFIKVLSMLNMCQHTLSSWQNNVKTSEKTKLKKPNKNTKLKKTKLRTLTIYCNNFIFVSWSSCISFSTTFMLFFVSVLVIFSQSPLWT